MKIKIILILLFGILTQSCITIKHSTLRVPDSETIKVGDCKISTTGAVYMNIFGLIKTNFIPASIKIEFDEIIMYIDPIINDDTIKADYIFITHNHLDHFSLPEIKKLSNSKTIILGPKTITKRFESDKVITVSIGDTINLGKIKCEVVESYNLNSKLHKQGSEFVGYIISCGTSRIYIAGDTDFIPEMKEFKNIKIAIIPIGEGKTAMNPKTASEFVNLIKPQVVIPVHYKLGKNREKDFKNLVNENIKVIFFQFPD